MTSEVCKETNEFLRRRKLRIQQVRDQSKDVAKRIRQRSNVKNFLKTDLEKEQEYLQKQAKFIEHLEEFYIKSLDNLGASHKSASEITNQDKRAKKDLTKLRGREAANELRKQKQVKLDEQKAILERKLHARQAANAVSREKSSLVINKLTTSSGDRTENKETAKDCDRIVDDNQQQWVPSKHDMGTQWENDDLKNEWDPNVIKLSLPTEIGDSASNSVPNNAESIVSKNKRPNLFALSDEMPSSLRGGLSNIPDVPLTGVKPSVTLVSEYLQKRTLRLRENEPSVRSQRKIEDLEGIKQTIEKSRISTHRVKSTRRTTDQVDRAPSKTGTVQMYNHITRDVKDVECADPVVVRDLQDDDDDAYSLAARVSSSETKRDNEQQTNVSRRGKVAMTKEHVEKEYKETMDLLETMAKHERGSTVHRKAFLDERIRKIQNEKYQRILQHQFNKIQGECRRRVGSAGKAGASNTKHAKCIPPERREPPHTSGEWQYSWLPVPEGDADLAVHAIPTEPRRNGNSVKFSEGAESYHEYRSRHKHTPPTRERSVDDDPRPKAPQPRACPVSTDSSDTSSFGDQSARNDNTSKDLSDAEKIVIYKILTSQSRKKRLKKNLLRVVETVAPRERSTREDDSGCVAVDTDSATRGEVQMVQDNPSVTGSARQEKQITCDIPKHVSKQTTCINQETTSNVFQPSEKSLTSVKTVSTDKVNDNIDSEGRLIRIIDNDGQEADNLFISASGFLNKNNYEVTIQLKKKENQKNKEQDEKHTPNTLVNTNEQHTSIGDNVCDALSEISVVKDIENNVQKSSEEFINGVVNLSSKKTSHPKEILTFSDINATNMSEKYQQNTDKVNYNKNKREIRNNNVCDKSVSTSFQLSFGIPCQEPKIDIGNNVKTSVFTQTTLSSPNSGPTFVHMSSSTSTAYMSPPDTVLPRFFKYNSASSCAEIGEKQYDVSPDTNLPKKPKSCEKHRSKHKQFVKSNVENVHSSSQPCKKSPMALGKHCSTLYQNSCKTSSKNYAEKKISRTRAYKNILPSFNSCSVSVEDTYRRTKNVICDSNGYKNPNMRPILKSYVNKLLALNKESLKAIDVINVDCSSVPTPGSSVINIPCNINENIPSMVESKISLEQIKNLFTQQLLRTKERDTLPVVKCMNGHNPIKKNSYARTPRWRPVHKVKSINVPKKMFKKKVLERSYARNIKPTKPDTSSSTKEDSEKQKTNFVKYRSKSTPTPRSCNHEHNTRHSSSDIQHTHVNIAGEKIEEMDYRSASKNILNNMKATKISSESHKNTEGKREPSIILASSGRIKTPTSILNSNNKNVVTEENFIKFAENKLQNIEKIAGLTEKCTDRLSNLAKVLEDVRRNKSLAYCLSSSEATSEAELKSNKNHINESELETLSPKSSEKSPQITNAKIVSENSNFIPFLENIPKPDLCQPSTETTNEEDKCKETVVKTRSKPPPALSRIHLKHAHDKIIPHELSAVIETDSPLSIKKKSHSKNSLSNESIIQEKQRQNIEITTIENDSKEKTSESQFICDNSNREEKISSPSIETQLEMMDIHHFNEIMLKPFITIQEYAEKYPKTNSIINQVLKNNHEVVNDELSSLHSDTSLPDVVAELLKRKIISEPFKFDTISNLHSSSDNSDSAISLLTLSKFRKEKTNELFHNKENISVTSDTLSISSNPDLENAFKKLGMGWASSTLKKTKQHLALSSSTNTSSSVLETKCLNKDIPVLLTESMSSKMTSLNKYSQHRESTDKSKDAEQQTTLTNSMTVKEFLNNELAKKITFTNKTSHEHSEEFVSLYETKMPNEIKNTSTTVCEAVKLNESVPTNNRARTSTPVQIFKSSPYVSSSSSNLSNGLFSNTDDLSSVKVTSSSLRNHSVSEKDELTIPNFSLKLNKTDKSQGD